MIIIIVLTLENQVLPLVTGRVTFPLRICTLAQRAAELFTFCTEVGEKEFRLFPRHSRLPKPGTREGLLFLAQYSTIWLFLPL